MSDTTASHPLATATLLGAGDSDRLAALLHNLVAEIADLRARLAALEARLDGADPGVAHDLAALQADTAALIDRISAGV